jgi:hypothetical protein
MKYSVGYIEIRFYAGPDKKDKIDQQPEPPDGLKKLIDIMKIMPGENCRGYCGGD